MTTRTNAPLLTLFVGDEFLRRRKITALRDSLLSKEEISFNFHSFEGKEVSFPGLIAQARSFPMLGKCQIFLIRDAGRIRKDDLALFEQYLEHPAEQSYFFMEADSLEPTHPLAKQARRMGQWVDCSENERRSHLNLIHKKLKNENRTITRDAWEFLEEKTGGNLALLDACIEKLILYTSPEMPIDAGMVEKLADELLVYDAFALTEAISERNTAQALDVLRFLCGFEGAAMVVGLLTWQLKRIWQAKVLRRQGSEQDVFRLIRMPYQKRAGFLKQVSRFDFEALERAFGRLFELDLQSKTGTLNDKIALESFVLELCFSPKEKGILA